MTNLTPSVRQQYLYLIAGIIWVAMGFVLSTMAIKWLAGSSGPAIFFALPGVVAGLIIHRYGFSKIADKNINRIASMGEKPCLFAFMAWRSYLLVVVMMTFGILLRHSAIPKNYLAVVYIAIGLALFLSGTKYFRHIRNKSPIMGQGDE
jgi:hypothetical protein